jgi:hypothetical protein
MTVFLKAKNYAAGAKFARRLLELNPAAPIVSKVSYILRYFMLFVLIGRFSRPVK